MKWCKTKRVYQQALVMLGCFCWSFIAVNSQPLHFNYITTQNGLPQNTVQAIMKDKYGFMWFGTWNGLCRYDGYQCKVYTHIAGDTSSIANNRIHYIYKDGEGTLWIATFNSQICRYNYHTDNFTCFKAAGLPAAIRDSTNRLRNVETLLSNSTRLQQYIGPFQLSASKAHLVFETVPNVQGGINDNNVYCMYRDNEDILWLGTASGGVNKADLRSHPFQSLSTGSAVRAIQATGSTLWLGTQNNGLLHTGAVPQNIAMLPGTGKNIRAVYNDSYGSLWIGYKNGLDRYDAQGNRLLHLSSAVPDAARPCTAITENPGDSTIWIGSLDGIYTYHRNKLLPAPGVPTALLYHAGITCLFFDTKHQLWIGTEYAGLIRLKRNARTHLFTDTLHYTNNSTATPWPDNRVYSITEDAKGNIWAGTANGLCCIQAVSGKVQVFTKHNGLADEYITAVLTDKQGNIWFSHKKGISKLTLPGNNIHNYTVTQGYQAPEFMEGAACIHPATGVVYFGSSQGIISFHPNNIINNPYPPVITLTATPLFPQPNGTALPLSGLTLSQKQNSLAFSFAALHFSHPEKNQYAYQLKGVDKEWIYTDAANRKAVYTHLPPGNYQFVVKAANSDGVWSTTPATFSFTISWPWWKTGWAYTAYALLLPAVGYLAFKKRRYRRRHQPPATEQIAPLPPVVPPLAPAPSAVPGSPAAAIHPADAVFLDNATRLIEANMSDAEVNVEWLAAQLLVSRTQLYRKIKALTHQSVHEFVTRIRLNKAAALLQQSEHSVTQIAFMVGYTDATAFSRMFQKQFGETPKKYSLKARNKQQPENQ